MSNKNKKGEVGVPKDKNTDILKKVLTRQSVKNNPELKNQISLPIHIQEKGAFQRRPLIPRSPVKEKPDGTSTPIINQNVKRNILQTLEDPPLLSNSQELEKNKTQEDDQSQEISELSNKTFTNTPTSLIIQKNLHEFSSLNLNDLTEIEGIDNQQSLILNYNKKITLFNEPNKYLQEVKGINKSIKDNLSKTASTIEKMSAQKIKIDSVVNTIPNFDGKPLSVDILISNLKDAEYLVQAADEENFVRLLIRQKFTGLAANIFKFNKPAYIKDLIKCIRELYPSLENFHALYADLQHINQKHNESCIEYIQRTMILVNKIKDIKRSNPNITEEEMKIFENEINQEAATSFKKGLKFELRIQMDPKDTFDIATRKAIKLESEMLESQRSNIASNYTNQKLNSSIYYYDNENNSNSLKIVTCQICKKNNHEALFCKSAACVYCKSPDHRSFDCNKTTKKIKLICNLCSNYGHSISACEYNKTDSRNCQYCQTSGHQVDQCKTIKEYEICWKCKKPGHDPFSCNNAIENLDVCEYCNKAGHLISKCPEVICQKCNNKGHTIKNCRINELRYRMCTLCQELGHDTSDCEEAKLFVLEQKTKQNLICQLCNNIGHLAKDCFIIKKLQSNKNTQQNDANQVKKNMTQKTCSYCKSRGHTIAECRKLQNLQNYTSLRENHYCDYCRKNGHSIENCLIIQQLESKLEMFCKNCKSNAHLTNECPRNRPYFQSNPGNASNSFVPSGQKQ